MRFRRAGQGRGRVTTIRDVGARTYRPMITSMCRCVDASQKELWLGRACCCDEGHWGDRVGHFDDSAGYRDGLFGPEPDFADGIARPRGNSQGRAFRSEEGATSLRRQYQAAFFRCRTKSIRHNHAGQRSLLWSMNRTGCGKKWRCIVMGDQAGREAIEPVVDSIEHGSFLNRNADLMKNKERFPRNAGWQRIYQGKMDAYPPALKPKGLLLKCALGNVSKRAEIGVTNFIRNRTRQFFLSENAKEIQIGCRFGMRGRCSPICDLERGRN